MLNSDEPFTAADLAPAAPVNPLSRAWDALAAAAMQIIPARLPLSVAKDDVDAVIADIVVIEDKFIALLAAYRDEVVDNVPGADGSYFDDARAQIEDAMAAIHGHLIDLGEQIEADEREREADRAGWAKASRMEVD